MSYPIKPHVVQNDDPIFGDQKWYAVDSWGATAGPYDTKEQAESKLKELEE